MASDGGPMHAVGDTAMERAAWFDGRPHNTPKSEPLWSLERLLEPVVLALAAPLALFPDRFPHTAVLIGLGLLAVPFLLRLATTGRLSAPTAANWPLLVLLLVLLPIDVWITPYFWDLTWPEMVRLIWGVAVLFGVANWCYPASLPRRTAEHVESAPRAALDRRVAAATIGYLLLGLAFATAGLFAIQAANKVSLLNVLVKDIPSVTRVGLHLANAFNPNRVAGLVILFVPLPVALWLAPYPSARGQVGRRLGILALKVGLLALSVYLSGILILTQSRAGWLCTGMALLLVFLLAGRRGVIPLACIALVMLATLSIYSPTRLLNLLTVRSSQSQQAHGLVARVLADRNVAGRIMIWRRALHGIADQPLTGMGLATFQHFAREPYPMQGWQPDPDITHAHNLFLQTGLDLGIPGLLAFVWVLGVVFWQAIRLFSHTQADTPARFLAIGLVGTLAAFVIFNLLDAVTLGALARCCRSVSVRAVYRGGLSIAQGGRPFQRANTRAK